MARKARHARLLPGLVVCALPLSGCLVDGRHLVVKKTSLAGTAGTLDAGLTSSDAAARRGDAAAMNGADGGSTSPSPGTNDAGRATATGGSGGAGGMTSGMDASSSIATGGVAGSGGTTPAPDHDAGHETGLPWPSVCPDDDGNGVPDCQESLVANATFDRDTTGWEAETGLTVAWKAADAWKSPPLGAVVLTNTNTFEQDGWGMSGVRQCIPVAPGAYYRLTASLYLPKGQGAGAGGIGAWVFDAPGCAGNLVLGYTSDLVSSVGRWASIDGTVQTPNTAKSMLVRLVVAKPFRQTALAAEFDGVRVRLKP
jgi:hypothetical protein